MSGQADKPRSYGRSAGELRPIEIEPNFMRTATVSALISAGETRVICTASAEESVSRWMSGRGTGWVTSEYGMLPASTGQRKQRDATRGRQDGRTVEIQRLIGRSLRGVVDFKALGERTIYLDCDVLQADGGTRCASITGAYVALALACAALQGKGKLERSPLTWIGQIGRGGDAARNGDPHPGVGPIGDHRLERVGVDGDGLVVGRPGVGRAQQRVRPHR